MGNTACFEKAVKNVAKKQRAQISYPDYYDREQVTGTDLRHIVAAWHEVLSIKKNGGYFEESETDIKGTVSYQCCVRADPFWGIFQSILLDLQPGCKAFVHQFDCDQPGEELIHLLIHGGDYHLETFARKVANFTLLLCCNGATPDFFVDLGNAIFSSLQHCLGDAAYHQAVDQAWRRAYSAILRVSLTVASDICNTAATTTTTSSSAVGNDSEENNITPSSSVLTEPQPQQLQQLQHQQHQEAALITHKPLDAAMVPSKGSPFVWQSGSPAVGRVTTGISRDNSWNDDSGLTTADNTPLSNWSTDEDMRCNSGSGSGNGSFNNHHGHHHHHHLNISVPGSKITSTTGATPYGPHAPGSGNTSTRGSAGMTGAWRSPPKGYHFCTSGNVKAAPGVDVPAPVAGVQGHVLSETAAKADTVTVTVPAPSPAPATGTKTTGIAAAGTTSTGASIIKRQYDDNPRRKKDRSLHKSVSFKLED